MAGKVCRTLVSLAVFVVLIIKYQIVWTYFSIMVYAALRRVNRTSQTIHGYG